MSMPNLSFFILVSALAIGIPLAIVCLNELADRSKRNGGSYIDLLTFVRDVILPLFVLLVMLRYIIVVNEENLPAKLLSTAFWLVLIVAIFRLSRRVIGSGDYAEEDWRSLVPHMFLRLPPYGIIGFVTYHIVQDLWSLPVRELATTLGIGSIVIAFALQETLSNLVSGLLLIANSPFKTGDWVNLGDVEGRIGEVNWRYTNIITPMGDLVVIPNGSIAGQSIKNFSRPERSTAVTQHFTVSFEHPPNEVKAMFLETLSNCEGVLEVPAPRIYVDNLDDPSLGYRLEYWVEDYSFKKPVHAKVMSRLWYALQRHNIALPTTTQNIFNYSGPDHNIQVESDALTLKSCLNWLPHFSRLQTETRSQLAEASTYLLYSVNETVITQYQIEPGLFVIISGSVSIDLPDHEADVRKTSILQTGEFFGETGLFGKPTSPATIIALDDCEILCIPYDQVNDALNRNPEFAKSISKIIDQRRSHNKSAATQAITRPIQASRFESSEEIEA